MCSHQPSTSVNHSWQAGLLPDFPSNCSVKILLRISELQMELDSAKVPQENFEIPPLYSWITCNKYNYNHVLNMDAWSIESWNPNEGGVISFGKIRLNGQFTIVDKISCWDHSNLLWQSVKWMRSWKDQVNSLCTNFDVTFLGSRPLICFALDPSLRERWISINIPKIGFSA